MDSEAKQRIAVVDDDFDIRSMLTLVLEMDGYEVVAAANGQEALDRLRTLDERRPGPPASLILLDLMMPIMNGWQFRAAQKEDPHLAPIPVVVLSGDGNVAEKTAAIGAAGYLRKPIDLEALLATVKGYC
jgi:CheY-like chemotaxis protein